MNEIVEITIPEEGSPIGILVKNTREDLFLDFEYFLGEAKKHDPNHPESMLLRARFLRAALIMLFAYTQSVKSEWLSALRSQRTKACNESERDSVDQKIKSLEQTLSATLVHPEVEHAQGIRNILSHFKSTDQAAAFDGLSLNSVEGAASVLFQWMTEIETILGLKRHLDSEDLITRFAEGFSSSTEFDQMK